MKVDKEKIKAATAMLLEAIGEDISREGLKETPERVAKAWSEFIDYQPGKIETAFQPVEVDQMIVVKGMSVFSFCEHHLAPFSTELTVGYISGDRVIGLSKIPRICHKFAHRLQIQERLVQQVASELKTLLGHENVAVIGQGVHSCMVSRGIKTHGVMICSSMNGIFRDESAARAEFLRISGY